jgi:hypothetical protein
VAGVTGGVQQRPRQRRFAGAEVAVQIDRQARLQDARQCGAERVGAGLVVQFVGMGAWGWWRGWHGWSGLHEMICRCDLGCYLRCYLKLTEW